MFYFSIKKQECHALNTKTIRVNISEDGFLNGQELFNLPFYQKNAKYCSV